MTFKKWILHFDEVLLPIGDLAIDIKHDPNFPDFNDYAAIYKHVDKYYDDRATEIFEKAWKYYIDCYDYLGIV